MGKWIEKVVANRLLFYGIRYNLIPRTQFGAMPGRSTTDAALCLLHDIKAADNHDLFTSVLTFDITGYFDNVNHARLLGILRNKGIPLPLCKWVRSFVSERGVEIRVDGVQNPQAQVQTGCPQGSPVSGVLANYYSAPLLEVFEQEYNNFQERRHDEFHTDPRNTHTHRQTPITVDLFVDDGKLHTSSTSLANNTRRLQQAFNKVLEWATENGVSIDGEKIDFIHFARKNKKTGELPSITLPTNLNTEETRAYEPKEHIRWLGIILDTRLTFDPHIKHLAKRGLAAASCLQMLANTVSGLTHENVKTLYTACVLPAITYATPVWWTRKKTHTKALNKVQNLCLRKILPVFRTTPTTAMETEAGVPPLSLRLDHIYQRAAARVAAKIDDSNPTYHRLPQKYRNRPINHNPIIPPLPITPIQRKRTFPTVPTKSPIDLLLSTVPTDIEIASPGHILDPWRPDIQDKGYGERFKVSPAVKGISKEEAAEAHRKHIARIANDSRAIVVYTDGSLIHDGGHNRAGAGWALYTKGIERAIGSTGLGTTAEVYDAEMTALSKGLRCAIDFFTNTHSYHIDTHTSIFLFSDNTSAVRSISSAAPGSSQSESQDFLEVARGFLDGHPQASINIEWVPGHRNITGNDRADEIAKAACHLEPQTPKTTLAHYYRTVKKSLVDAWKNAWTETPRRGNYAIADRLPPSILGSYPFRQYDRATLGLITQVRTGHGHFGEYYQRFNIPEPYDCPCGAVIQTRTHIIFECPQYDEARHIIYTAAPDGHIGTLLGTKKGIDGLAVFLRQTKAFRKPPTPTPTSPPPPLAEDDPAS